MVLTADKTTSKGKVHGRTQEAIIADTVTMYRGALACFDTSGELIPLAHATANLKFAGVIIRGGLGVAAGTVIGVFERRGTRWLVHNGTAALGNKGKIAYGIDDEKVDDDETAPTNRYVIGKIVDVDVAGNLVEVDLEDRVHAEVSGSNFTGTLATATFINGICTVASA